jgi:hypothetical protein
VAHQAARRPGRRMPAGEGAGGERSSRWAQAVNPWGSPLPFPG